MKSRGRISATDLERLRVDMTSAAPMAPEAFTKQKAVERLTPEIRSMQGKGYSLAAIARFMTERGLTVTHGALKALLRGASGKYGRRIKGGERKTAAKQVVTAEPNAPPPGTSAASPTAGTRAASGGGLATEGATGRGRQLGSPAPGPAPAAVVSPEGSGSGAEKSASAEKRGGMFPIKKDSDDL